MYLAHERHFFHHLYPLENSNWTWYISLIVLVFESPPPPGNSNPFCGVCVYLHIIQCRMQQNNFVIFFTIYLVGLNKIFLMCSRKGNFRIWTLWTLWKNTGIPSTTTGADSRRNHDWRVQKGKPKENTTD